MPRAEVSNEQHAILLQPQKSKRTHILTTDRLPASEQPQSSCLPFPVLSPEILPWRLITPTTTYLLTTRCGFDCSSTSETAATKGDVNAGGQETWSMLCGACCCEVQNMVMTPSLGTNTVGGMTYDPFILSFHMHPTPTTCAHQAWASVRLTYMNSHCIARQTLTFASLKRRRVEERSVQNAPLLVVPPADFGYPAPNRGPVSVPTVVGNGNGGSCQPRLRRHHVPYTTRPSLIDAPLLNSY